MTSSCWYCRKGGLVDLYFAGRTGVCPKCGKGVNVKFDAERFMTLDTILTGVEEWAKSAGTGGSEPNEPLTLAQLEALPNGTTVYCYKLVDGKLEPDDWCIKRTKNGKKLKHNGGWMQLEKYAIDAEKNTRHRRAYLKEVDLNTGNSGNSGNGKPREYKVDDHVIVEKDNIGGGYAGKTGVISEIWPNPHAFPYRVDFDNEPGLSIWCSVKGLVEEKPLTTEELMRMDGQRVWCSVKLPSGESFNSDMFSTIGWYIVNAKDDEVREEGGGGCYNIYSNGNDYSFRAYRTDQSHRANEEEIPF